MTDLTMQQGVDGTGLSKSFGNRTIFCDLDLTLDCGQPSILIGPNGAGKTTLMDIVAAETHPDSGSLTFDGKPVASLRRDAIRFIQQRAGLLPELTVGEMISLWGNLFDDVDATRGLDVKFGLDHTGSTMVKQMSGGEQQRLRLALSTIGRADIYLYDEPTNNLDADARSLVCDLITANANKGSVVLVATHDIELLAEVAGPVLMLQDGTLTQVRAADAKTSSMIVGDRDVMVEDFASLDQVFAYGRGAA